MSDSLDSTSNFSSLKQLPEWLHWLESCPSTNTWAINHGTNLEHGVVVFTRHQTSGRGQYGRTWYSPTGVLTASFILDRIPVAALSGLSLVAGLAVIYAVEDLLPDLEGKLRLKWTNDVLFEERKLAGILCETKADGDRNRVIVGVGLNRCVDFARSNLDLDSIVNPISLHQFSSVPEELLLLERIRDYLMQVRDLIAYEQLKCRRRSTRSDPDQHNQTKSLGISAFLPELRRRDFLLNRSIRLELMGEELAGKAIGIDAQGRLLIKFSDDRIRAFSSGRVIWWE